MKKELETLRISLFEEMDTIENMLGSLRGAESDSLRSEIKEKIKRLESLSDDELSSFKLTFLQKEIGKIKKKAASLATTPLLVTRSRLLEEIDDIENTLKPLKGIETDPLESERNKFGKDADSLRSEIMDKLNRLKSLDESDLSSSIRSLQTEIDEIKKRAESLATKYFLLTEIDLIKNILGPAKVGLFKRSALGSLQSQIMEKKEKLESPDDLELTVLRKEIGKIKERAEVLVTRPGLLDRIRSVSALVWIGIIPLLIVIYTGYITIWQIRHQKEIHEIATMTASAMPTSTETSIPTITPVP